LAEKLGKPQSFVSKYERGERRLDFIEFMSLAEALSLDVHNFLTVYTDKVAAQNSLESIAEVAEEQDVSQIVCPVRGAEASRQE